jgi:ubiquinone/menaquinone biosynthesis C-methylase UbiE
MKRMPLTHDRIFSDEDYAESYAKQHWKMAEKFGQEYSQKLAARGFQRGKIIDVGCGFGATNLILAERFVDSEIIGIDLSEPLLGLARADARGAALEKRVRFEKADVQKIPYPDNSFDVVVNVNMVHLVEDPIAMLNEIERILVPRGHLLIADLRRSLLGMLEEEIKAGLTIGGARKLFNQSDLRPGKFSWGLLWWRFEGGRYKLA